jgi:hypothetical protein
MDRLKMVNYSKCLMDELEWGATALNQAVLVRFLRSLAESEIVYRIRLI